MKATTKAAPILHTTIRAASSLPECRWSFDISLMRQRGATGSSPLATAMGIRVLGDGAWQARVQGRR